MPAYRCGASEEEDYLYLVPSVRMGQFFTNFNRIAVDIYLVAHFMEKTRVWKGANIVFVQRRAIQAI